jgi:FkbM family methyltransferase
MPLIVRGAGYCYAQLRNMSLSIAAGRITRPITDHLTYTDRGSVARGMRRRGGLGFIPRAATPEERYVLAMEVSGKVVYDVGAFQGLFTLRFARDARHVVTFEPHPWCRAVTAENVRLNDLMSRVTIVPMALSDTAGLATLCYPPKEPARSTIDPKIAAGLERSGFRLQRESVLCWPLDRAISELHLPPPDIIKIDAEGAEESILRGAAMTIGRCRPALYIELHGTRPGVERVLADYGYAVSGVDDSHIWATDTASSHAARRETAAARRT